MSCRSYLPSLVLSFGRRGAGGVMMSFCSGVVGQHHPPPPLLSIVALTSVQPWFALRSLARRHGPPSERTSHLPARGWGQSNIHLGSKLGKCLCCPAIVHLHSRCRRSVYCLVWPAYLRYETRSRMSGPPWCSAVPTDFEHRLQSLAGSTDCWLSEFSL